MLTIDPAAFNRAVEALMIAAISVKDQQGLRVRADTPRGAPLGHTEAGVLDFNDWPRIRAITLGAIVSLVNGAAVPGDEVHFGGLRIPSAQRE